MYAVVFLILSNLFTYTYFNKNTDKSVKSLEKTLQIKEDSIQQLLIKNFNLSTFELSNNQLSLDYFYNKETNQYKNYEEVELLIREALYEKNDSKEGNPLVGFEKMNERKFVIEQFRIINHRWLVANFSDGTFDGEVILKYFLNNDDSVDFEIIETIILPKQRD